MRRLSWPSRRESEDGFTLIEVLVSLGVIFATLLVLAFTMFSSFAAVGFSRQRTEASALANQQIELIRALPNDMLYMSQPDVAGGVDTQIVACTAPLVGLCFGTNPQRVIPTATFTSATAQTPFFNPSLHPQPDHWATQTGAPGTTQYTIKSYVTLDPTDTTNQTKIATVQVSWAPAQVGGVLPSVQVETKIFTSPFNENNPGSTTTTTIAASHNWSAIAGGAVGTIKVSGQVLGLQATDVQFSLPAEKASLAGNTASGTSVGPVSAATASSYIKALNITPLNTPAAAAGPLTSASGAGPLRALNSATPGLFGSIPSSVNQCTVLLVCTLIGGTVDAQIAAGSVTSAGAVAASSSDGITLNVPNGSGTIPGSSLGYGRASASQTGALSSNLGVNVAGIPLLNLGLVNLVPLGNGTPDLATAEQHGSASPLSQTYTATSSKSFSRIDVLTGLPLVGPLVSLQGFQMTANACAGPASCNATPTAASQHGTLTIAGLLNTIDLSTTAAGLINNIPPINIPVGILNVAATISVTVGSVVHTSSGATSSASVSSPVSITVHLAISTLLGPVVGIDVVVDLGSVTTTASYS